MMEMNLSFSNKEDGMQDSVVNSSKSHINVPLIGPSINISTSRYDNAVEYTFISSYFIAAWAGIPIFVHNPRLQAIYDVLWALDIPAFGMLYCVFMVDAGGLATNAMWIFIELQAMGCWSTFFWALRYHNAYAHTFTIDKIVWRADLVLVIISMLLYSFIAWIYFSSFLSLLTSNIFQDTVEVMHGVTSWARFGAAAIPSQAFFATAISLSYELQYIRSKVESELNEASVVRWTAYRKADSVLSVGPSQRREHWIHRWDEALGQAKRAGSLFSPMIAIQIITTAFGFVSWVINSLVNSGSADTSIAGAVIGGITILCCITIAAAAQLTIQMQKTSIAVAKYWSCSAQSDIKDLYPGLADSITLHLINGDFAFKVLDFSIRPTFLFQFLSTVGTLTVAVLRLQTK
jgi:hypothetical protein